MSVPFVKLDEAGMRQFRDELRLGAQSVGALTDDNLQFVLRVTEVGDDLTVSGLRAQLASPADRVLRAGENAQLVCGLRGGSYLARVRVREVGDQDILFIFDGEVQRLERRNDYRTPVPKGFGIAFRLNSLNRQVIAGNAENPDFNKLGLIDVSAKGMRLQWPAPPPGYRKAPALPEPKVGDHLSGLLMMPGGRQAEIFGIVKTLVAGEGLWQVGVELQNIGLRDEQFLLFVCLRLHRGR